MKRAFVNGKIFTSDTSEPGALYAEALLCDGGRILFAGAEKDLPAGEYPRIDLGGRTVIPGFVDAHMHPVMLADFSRQIACLPPKVNSIQELIQEIARVRSEKPEGDWIKGWGYDEGKFAEHRSPNRYDLDKGSSDFPVFLTRSCEHIRCVNSKALELAGITRDTPDPQGGEIERDEHGEPTGVLKENARDLVLPFMPPETKESTVASLIDLGDLLTSQGIVAVTDMGNLHEGGNYEFYEEAVKRGFRQRVSLYYMWDYFMDDPLFDITPELMDRNRQIRIAGLKLIGDGSISGKTAWLSEPYLGTEECGFPVYSDESMERALEFCKRTGCQLSVHAMGGRAIDRVIDRVYPEKDWTDGKVPCLRVEHLTEPSDRAVARAAERGFGFASQPIFEYCEIETYKSNMDPERLRHIYPHRTMLDRGVKLCLSTDAPATSWAVPSDPFSNLKSAVTRYACDGTDIGQDERLDIETAMILYTKESAKVSGFAGLGVLKPGYAADFAVLSDDLFTVDPMKIDEVRVEETYIGGERVYCREDLRDQNQYR
ncbi:MAG: amidohydrolase [Clostridiales bacterium]|uniref:amidohydrolase n=1 Tax=Hornefia butyriciproducens TaxID=2652293 RepID=UPI0029FE17EA|nr:amidohydrolase [Hornefia butyriciproducens]MCI7678681.1 amidohydrolase [Clostridiales bacterium]MDD7020245.1 amidohydrolase [Hornefia butyriciproducens]MDY5462404.1 amidohydrolase [Hornefia butyriciproducens]